MTYVTNASGCCKFILKLQQETMTDLDEIIQQCVTDIWSKFDKDNNEILDKIECKRFVSSILGHNAGSLSAEEFSTLFDEFDRDGNGVIEKKEMSQFLKKALGLNY